MANDFDFTIKSNIKEVITATDEAIQGALEAVGIQAETNAKMEITAMGAIDTGNLRNSITHTTESGGATVPAVYIGTNVEYAPYVEFGHKLKGGGTVAPRPFLENAAANYLDEYAEIFKEYLEYLSNS